MLRVWLPLTKDLRQQGLSNVTVTNSGATFDSVGKLGGCYSFDGTDDAIGVGDLSNLVNTDFSFACWFYHDDTWSSKGWETIFGGPSGFELQTKNFTTNSPVIYAYSWGKGNFTYELSKWNHLVMTRTTSETKIYLNGELKLTGSTGSIPSGDYFIGSWKNSTRQNFKGKVNDVRIYDHCLSEMEVKELSKGLVLHYPLADTCVEATTNLITTEDCLSASCYNGATSKYGYGTNTDMYKTVTTYDGRKGTKVYMGTNGNAAFPYVYINNMYTSDGTNSPAYKTLSFDYYTNIGTSIRPYKLGSGSGTATYRITNKNGIATGTGTDAVSIPVVANGWNHIEITFHGTTAADSRWGYIQNYPSHTSNTNNFWFFANMQLETKDHATGYAGVGGTRTPTIVYDCSGFCNNGAISGILSINNDTPKYQISTHIGTTSSKIHISNFPTSGFGNSYSFAWWGKRTSNNPMFWGFSDGIRLNGMYIGTLWDTGDASNNPLYKIGTTTQVTAPSVNVWHHYVMTGNGTKCYVYLDGELWAEAKTYKAISGTSIYINGWNSATDYCSDNTDMSDFRIYATALSADDVKSLYQNCATIDADGTIRGQIRS